MQALYKNIKAYRLLKGWSQQRLADAVGYSDRSSIAKIESGRVDLSRSKIEEFAEALGTTPARLMGWEQEPSLLEMVAEDNNMQNATELLKHNRGSNVLSDLINGDSELTAYLDSLRTRPEMRMLFSVANDCTKEDVEKAVAVIEALRKTEGK